mgnify:CR=1 FL=1
MLIGSSTINFRVMLFERHLLGSRFSGFLLGFYSMHCQYPLLAPFLYDPSYIGKSTTYPYAARYASTLQILVFVWVSTHLGT